MTFKDYTKTPQNLIGKSVVRICGDGLYGIRRSLHTIVRLTDSGKFFEISGVADVLFFVKDGYSRRKSQKFDSTIDHCSLISEEAKIELIKQWKEKKQKKEVLDRVTRLLPNLTLEQLVEISKLIP